MKVKLLRARYINYVNQLHSVIAIMAAGEFICVHKKREALSELQHFGRTLYYLPVMASLALWVYAARVVCVYLL
jgi:hypothetical protein